MLIATRFSKGSVASGISGVSGMAGGYAADVKMPSRV